DGARIYVSLTNHHHVPYQLTQDGNLTSTTATGGSWAALDAATGKIIWQTADPQTETLPAPTGTVGVWDLAPVTVSAGVVYAASPNGSRGSYTAPVGVAVSATDASPASGVARTRCAIDPATIPKSYADLPAHGCSLKSVSSAGTHTVYAASVDRNNNVEAPVS